MRPEGARLALTQFGLSEVIALLAYAEGFGLVIGSLGVGLVPGQVLPHVAALVIDGAHPWTPQHHTFPDHIRRVLRRLLVSRLRMEATTRVSPSEPHAVTEVRMAGTQVGGLASVALLAHNAGAMMEFHRARDGTTVAPAVVICDRVRERLEVIAALAGPEDAPSLVLEEAAPLPPPPAGPYPHAAHDAPTPPRRPTDRRWPDESR